jgi:hypothetical protein
MTEDVEHVSFITYHLHIFFDEVSFKDSGSFFIFYFFESEFYCKTQAGLELMTSYLSFLSALMVGPCLNLDVLFLLNFKSSLHILDNSPLSDVSFANIFSQSWLAFSFS